MPEMHLRQHAAHDKFGFTYRAWGAFTKSKEWIQKFKETGDSWHIFPNKLDKACFKSDMAYGDFKYLIRTTAFDKYILIKHLILLKIRYMMDIKKVLLQWFINFLIKNLLCLRCQRPYVWRSTQTSRDKSASGSGIKN